MSFGNELRNINSQSEKQRRGDEFRKFVKGCGVAEAICQQIRPTCISAARKGMRSATVSLSYIAHHYKDVEFYSDIEFIFKKSLYNQILYDETNLYLREVCSKLDIQFVDIRGKYYHNGDAPSSYDIFAEFRW